jgi:DNA modification methylase
MKITDLKPYEKNAKKHDRKQIALIAASIRQFGFGQPIVIDAEDAVIVGHGRLEAAKSLGWTEAREGVARAKKGEEFVPVVRAEDLTPDEVAAYRLADNKLNESPWDMQLAMDDLKLLSDDLLALTGFDRDLIVEPDEHDDDAPEPPVIPRTKLGDVYGLGQHRLVCGDSTEAETFRKLLDDDKAAMCFADPPYNVAYKGSGKKTSQGILNDDLGGESFGKLITEAMARIAERTEAEAGWYIFHSSTTQDQFRAAIEAAGMEVKSQLIWNKPSAALGMGDYRSKHEPFFYCQRKGKRARFYGDRTHATVTDFTYSDQKLLAWAKRQRRAEQEGRTTIWTMRREPVAGYVHPTQKPVELITYAISNSSRPGDIVLDPFAGSGSALIASEKLGRRARLIELDQKYCDVIVGRWCGWAKQGTVKLNGKEIEWDKSSKTE